MPVIGCLEIFQNGRSPQPITGIIYSPGPHELKIGSAVEDTLGFIPLVLRIFIYLAMQIMVSTEGGLRF